MWERGPAVEPKCPGESDVRHRVGECACFWPTPKVAGRPADACPDRTHSPRLFDGQWVCPDCTPYVRCRVEDCDGMLATARNAKVLLDPTAWICREHHPQPAPDHGPALADTLRETP